MSLEYIRLPIVADITKLPPETLAGILDMTKTIQDYLAAAHTAAKARLQAGESVPGYAIVPGKRSRAWKSDDDAKLGMAAVGINDPYKPSVLKTPAEAEAALTPEQIEELKVFWQWHPGKPSMKKVADGAAPAAVPPTGIDDLPADTMPDW